MIFIRQTLFYLRKNFFHLCVFALPAAVMYALNTNSFNIPDLIIGLRKGAFSLRFDNVYESFSLINFKKPYLTILSVLSTAIFLSLATGFIEKHMRIGKRSFGSFLNRLNDNSMPVLFVMLLLTVMYELWAVLLSAVLVMAGLIASGASVLGIFLISIAIIVIFYIILFSIVGFFVIWLPCILITGFAAGEAFVYSLSLVPEKLGIIFSLALPYITGFALTVILRELLGGTAGVLFSGIVFMFYFIYYSALMFNAYFIVTKEPRADLKKKYF